MKFRWRSQILTGIGNAYFTHHNIKLGLAYLYEGLAFAELQNQPYNLTSAYYPLELAYRKLGNRDSCIYFAKKEFEESKTASFILEWLNQAPYSPNSIMEIMTMKRRAIIK